MLRSDSVHRIALLFSVLYQVAGRESKTNQVSSALPSTRVQYWDDSSREGLEAPLSCDTFEVSWGQGTLDFPFSDLQRWHFHWKPPVLIPGHL